MTDYIKREDLLDLYDLGGLEIENAKVPLNVVIQTIKDMPSADAVEIKKEGEWEMFDLISSAYYGKGMYFKQDNGIVYSRHSGGYMTVDEAIREFISLIDEEELPNYVLQKKGKWMHKKITADLHAIGQCSVCKEVRRIDNFCPNCGAQMERSGE